MSRCTVAGVVDQHVDRDTATRGFLAKRRRRGRIGEVAGDVVDIDGMFGAQFGRERCETVRASRGQHEWVAACCEFARERGYDAGGSAGDQRKSRLFQRWFLAAKGG